MIMFPMSKQSQVIPHGWHILGKLANPFAYNTFRNKHKYTLISCLHNISMDSLRQVSPIPGLMPSTKPQPLRNWAVQVAGEHECISTFMSGGHSHAKLHLYKWQALVREIPKHQSMEPSPAPCQSTKLERLGDCWSKEHQNLKAEPSALPLWLISRFKCWNSWEVNQGMLIFKSWIRVISTKNCIHYYD